MSLKSEDGGIDTEGVLDLLTDEFAEDADQIAGNGSKDGMRVWCEECGVHNIGECFIHGGTITVQPDEALPTKACLSLPKILSLKRVKDEDPCSLEAKKGVFSKKPLDARTMFGPLEAVLSLEKPKLPTGSMEYLLTTPQGIPLHYDTTNEDSCNWMMFVRPANTFEQQNMAAFQKGEQIYFITCKNIPTGTELRVWYAAAYAKAIGKRMLLPDNGDRNVVKKSLPPSVKKETIPDSERQPKAVKKEKKQIGSVRTSSRANKGNMAALLSVEGESIEVKNNGDQLQLPNTDDHPSVGSGKGTRSARATKEPNILLACHTCNTTFTTVGQLDSHVCKELGEGEDDNPGYGTRRRKGKPRKLLDNEDSPPAAKVAKIDQLREETSSPTVDASIPDDFLVSQDTEDDSVGKNKTGETKDILTLLPSTALIPTTAEFSGDDVENHTAPKRRRGRGRPRGSKTGVKIQVKPEMSTGKRPTFTCQYCSENFYSHEQYLVHEASHTNTLPYTCQIEDCGKSFSSKFKFQRHMMVHEKPNNYKCKFCSKTFNRVDHLKNHLLVHDSNRDTFTCKICGKSYLNKASLTFHMAKHEAEEGDTLTCLVCNKTYSNKEDLKNHVNTHNRYKPEQERNRKHKCPSCEKTFTTAKDIGRHMVTHSKERRFLCEHCPQTFVRKDHLRRHYTSNHKKEFYESQMKTNPFGCSACLMVFKKQEFLDYHMKTVHPDGTFETDPKKDKGSKYTVTVKPMGLSPDNIDPSDNQKDTTNSLGKLQKQLKSKEKKRLPQLVMKPTSCAPPESKPVPVSLHRNEQAGLSDTSKHYAILCQTTNMQSVESQTPVYDMEELNPEVFTSAIKTIPFRFQNQLVSQPQVQTQVQVNSQKSQLQQDNQQQQQQQQQFVQDSQLLTQLQLQQQQTQLQQQQFEQQKRQQEQQQLQQQQQQQQAQLQSITPVVQCLPVSDMLNNLATLSQTQDMAGPPNANVYNIITLGGNNFIVGGGQVMELNKYFPMAVVKDAQADSRPAVQQLLQPQVQPMGVKTEGTCLVTSQGQLMRANVAKPDHCYATRYAMANPTLTQILNNPNKSQTSGMEKSGSLQGPCITDEEATRIMAQMKNAGSNSSIVNVNTGNLPDTLQSQTELLVTSQQLQQQQQQQITQNQFHQQDSLQEQQQQQQQLQGLPSFIWADSLDYTPVTELPIVSSDVSSINQGDGLSTAVAGSASTSWIVQLPTSVLDAPQLQTQSLQGPQIMTVTTSVATDT